MSEKELSERLERMIPVDSHCNGMPVVMMTPEAWEETRKGLVLLYNKIHYPEYEGQLCQYCYSLPNEAGECPKCL